VGKDSETPPEKRETGENYAIFTHRRRLTLVLKTGCGVKEEHPAGSSGIDAALAKEQASTVAGT
jgi:hypothetical protein